VTGNPLLEGGTLRREMHLWERSGRSTAQVVLRDGWKPGEPHGRRRGATNPHGLVRIKPSQSGRTARADHVRKVALPDPGQPGSGIHEEHDGGAVFEKTPREEPGSGSQQTLRWAVAVVKKGRARPGSLCR
jgi:hypothetical protein